jgi:hypothetical protein
MIIPNIWKNKIHVPNHQPVCKINLVSDSSKFHDPFMPFPALARIDSRCSHSSSVASTPCEPGRQRPTMSDGTFTSDWPSQIVYEKKQPKCYYANPFVCCLNPFIVDISPHSTVSVWRWLRMGYTMVVHPQMVIFGKCTVTVLGFHSVPLNSFHAPISIAGIYGCPSPPKKRYTVWTLANQSWQLKIWYKWRSIAKVIERTFQLHGKFSIAMLPCWITGKVGKLIHGHVFIKLTISRTLIMYSV